ncbi:MAG: hypothetical protein IPH07_06510 [Deltaproteobacteria bacterium]|nr:hypothetical protein [Deltaproteobacteria bacterium]MBK8236384.1 hypothetical protein [Deltaproteobacteria bacterium]MBK8717997.1 hypothetical protein [Deltaproteobacteria bacterium]MBP7290162.1 hypothetical protein [Nannocystaceae bacterium]
MLVTDRNCGHHPIPARVQADGPGRGIRARGLSLAASIACGLVAGFVTALGCATSDQVLEKRLREQELAEGGPTCHERVSEACYTGPKGTSGRGACKAGTRTCDGAGQWGECSGQVLPATESCNRNDDDCDGIVDNGFERDGALCFFKGAKGACRTQGVWHCSADGKESTCDAKVVRPQAETCNAIDDDCDGETDEDSVPVDAQACTTGKSGVCQAGTNKCVNGQTRCVQNIQPGAEICNKQDDDCDGRIDNDCVSESAARKQGGM